MGYKRATRIIKNIRRIADMKVNYTGNGVGTTVNF